MKFIFFGFSLNQNTQLQLFTPEKSKNEIFWDILSDNMEYKHYSDVKYVFDKKVDNYIVGQIWRKSSKTITEFKNDWFEDKKTTHYPHSLVIFNISEDYKTWWHRLMLEWKTEVFKNPIDQIKFFENILNTKLQSFWYSLSFYPLFDECNFWKYIDSNSWKIEKLTFSYSVPNFLHLKTTLSQDLKDAQKRTSITNATVILENKNGSLDIKQWDEFIDQSVEYASKGAWEFRIKLRGIKAEYSSSKNIKSITVDEIDINTTASGIKSLFDKWI